MYTIISSKIIFSVDNYQDIINKFYEYYNNVIIFKKNLNLKDFLNSFIIIESKNNVIITEYKASKLYDIMINNINKINDNTKNEINDFNKVINNEINNVKPIKNNIPKKVELNHTFNNKKTLNFASINSEDDDKILNKDDEERNEYEKMFKETSIYPSMVDLKKSDDVIDKLKQFLDVDINSYDNDKFNSFIKYIKDVLLMEPIHNNNIEIINKTINVLCNLLTSKFHEKTKDKNIKDVIILMQEKIKQFNYQTTQLKKQSEEQQKIKRENLINIYKSNLEVFNIIKAKNPDLENDINKINESNTIPNQFKIMYYAYLNSSNLDEFIKAFNNYYHTIGQKIDFFREFLV